jgi:acyl-CoA thioester hydrolase
VKSNTTEVRVRYSETDQMGLVYNSHLLVYFEIGRVEYMRRLGAPYAELEERGYRLPVVEAHCIYAGQAGYDDLLEVVTWVDRLRPTRIDFRHLVRRKSDGRSIAEGHVVLACLGSDMRPRKLPAEITDAVELWDGTAG